MPEGNTKRQWGGRRKMIKKGPMRHTRLELPDDEQEILKTIAKYNETTVLGYVRWLVRREILRFKDGRQTSSPKVQQGKAG